MSYLDTFVDTKEKRRCAYAVLVILTMMILGFAYVRQSRMLIAIQEYEDVFYLLRSPLIDQTYLSRIIVTLIQHDLLNVRILIQALLSALRMGEVAAFLLWILLGMTRTYRRIFHWLLGLLALWAIAIALMIVTALQSETLMQAVRLLHLIGYATLVIFSVISILQCFVLFHYLRAYRKALKYQVVEIASPQDIKQEKTYGQ